MEVTFKNIQVINGENHPTNTYIECNAGNYISAVEPALESVSAGWKLDLTGVTISCIDVSPRLDTSGKHVSTKLVFMVAVNTSSKIVLHFYHTSNTILVQGSTIMPEGISFAAWLVKHFLEPLAAMHSAQNSLQIEAINSTIRQTTTFPCGGCNDPINPTASLPKDQELSCSKCRKLFHKRCTDRRKTTANWRKSPWYCLGCVLGSQNNLHTADQRSVPQPSLNPSARVFQPLAQFSEQPQPVQSPDQSPPQQDPAEAAQRLSVDSQIQPEPHPVLTGQPNPATPAPDVAQTSPASISSPVTQPTPPGVLSAPASGTVLQTIPSSMLSPAGVRWSSPAAMLSSAVSTPIHTDPNLDANQRVPNPTLLGSQSQPRFPSTATKLLLIPAEAPSVSNKQN